MRVGLMLVVSLAMTTTCFGEGSCRVLVDWAKGQNGLLDYPADLNGPVTCAILVQNVNNIVYRYDVNLKSEPVSAAPDIEALLNALPTKAAGRGPSDLCLEDSSEKLNALGAALKKRPFQPAKSGDAYESIPLQETVNGWNTLDATGTLVDIRKILAKHAGDSGCKDKIAEFLNKTVKPVDEMVNAIDTKVRASHTIEASRRLFPGNKYIVVVDEYYLPPGSATALSTNAGKQYSFTPESHILTLSAGVMATKVGSRSYGSRKVPDVAKPVLVVEDNSSLRPGGVALLNYQLPWLDWYHLGFAVSGGPAIKLGSQGGDVSTLGFFMGASVHLWHRLYITPGVHFAEFADFPAGFYSGRPIPDNFGDLQPVKRHTVRFAIAISFKASDFAKATGSGSGQTQPAPAGKQKEVPNIRR